MKLSFQKMDKQAGDTIIEVLLAMTVIGMVLGASFGIANRSTNLGQDAQERTEALKLAESQIELFKVAYNQNSEIKNKNELQPFCLINDSNYSVQDVDSASCKNIDSSGNPDGLYSISIIPPGDLVSDPTATYEFKVTWLRLGAKDNGDADNLNNISLYYKPGAL